jgi:hypothetical protein
MTRSFISRSGVRRLGLAAAALAAAAAAVVAAPRGLMWARAATEGLMAGARLVGEAALSLLQHPTATLRGITIAADRHVEGLKEWLGTGAAYAAAWRVDPAGFAAASFTLLACAAACVAVAGAWDHVTDRMTFTLSRAARERMRHIRRIRHGPIVQLWRARAMRREQRRGQRVAGVRAPLQRITWWARDLADGLRLLAARPAPASAFFACQAAGGAIRIAGGLLRVASQRLAYLVLPVVLIAAPWIDFSIHLDDVAEAAERDIAPAARRYVDDAAELNLADLSARTEQMRTRYAEHRQRLLAPLAALDSELGRELGTINRAVAAGDLDGATIDYRTDRALSRYASRTTLISERIVLHSAGAPHGPYEPSSNWLESIRDEQALFESARTRSTRAESQRHLDETIAAVAAQWSYESCVLLENPRQLAEGPLPATHPRCGASSINARALP